MKETPNLPQVRFRDRSARPPAEFDQEVLSPPTEVRLNDPARTEPLYLVSKVDSHGFGHVQRAL